MFLGGEDIALLTIALYVSQDEVVTQIDRILRPRYEMVHIALVAEGLVAVEACVFLDFSKDRAVDIQGPRARPRIEKTQGRCCGPKPEGFDCGQN